MRRLKKAHIIHGKKIIFRQVEIEIRRVIVIICDCVCRLNDLLDIYWTFVLTMHVIYCIYSFKDIGA